MAGRPIDRVDDEADDPEGRPAAELDFGRSLHLGYSQGRPVLAKPSRPKLAL
jgi:hypothetical protein